MELYTQDKKHMKSFLIVENLKQRINKVFFILVTNSMLEKNKKNFRFSEVFSNHN